MKKQILWACCVLMVISTVVAALALKTNTSTSLEQSLGKTRVMRNASESIIQPLQDARIVNLTKWPVGDSESDALWCIVRAFDQDPKYEGAGVKLSIFDKVGKVIYEDYFSDVHRIYSSYALRQTSPQLVLDVDYGGSASFLRMLEYKNSRVVNLMDAAKANSDFTINAEVRPQLRSGINPAVEPDQILLTDGVGLASHAQKSTSVFRYNDGAYQYIGAFSQQKVDDYIEELIKRPQSQSGKK